jgi:predicted esterase
MSPVMPRVTSVPYGAGKLLDVYEPLDHGALPVVLLWHGSGPDERDALAVLASAVAMRGSVCLVPDWQSKDSILGRENLLASVSFGRRTAPEFGGDRDRIALCGWSLGAKAAADLMLHPQAAGGWRPCAFVGLAGGYDSSPITDAPLAKDRTTEASVPCLLIHGTRDHIVPVQRSREFHHALQDWGWQSELKELDTDHAGIIGTRYDPDRGRCVSSDDPTHTRAVERVAGWVFAHVNSA